MRKFCILLCACALLLCACGAKEPSFTATVLEAGENSLLVAPEAGQDILRSADQIHIALPDALEDIQAGDRVRVRYDGQVAESYPAQVQASAVERLP